MTTNQERAAEAIADDLAQALADAGLLTPDLPHPEDAKPDPQPGEAWLIEYEGGYYDAVYWYSPLYAHWSFVESREGLKTVESNEAKAWRRLVPERGDVS